jgi:hypothetical protein
MSSPAAYVTLTHTPSVRENQSRRIHAYPCRCAPSTRLPSIAQGSPVERRAGPGRDDAGHGSAGDHSRRPERTRWRPWRAEGAPFQRTNDFCRFSQNCQSLVSPDCSLLSLSQECCGLNLVTTMISPAIVTPQPRRGIVSPARKSLSSQGDTMISRVTSKNSPHTGF